jgi:transcriptional regulator with XRE-family HTH domain
MKLKRRQKECGLNDRALAEKAGVSTATIYRAKKADVSRYRPMEQMAGALGCEVWDIDEFRDALRERVYREAEKRGAPPQVIAEADQMAETFTVVVPDEGDVQQGAYRVLRDAIAYLDRTGRGDLVDKAIRGRK